MIFFTGPVNLGLTAEPTLQHTNIFIANAHYANSFFYTFTGDISSFMPEDKEIRCRFYTCCYLDLGKKHLGFAPQPFGKIMIWHMLVCQRGWLSQRHRYSINRCLANIKGLGKSPLLKFQILTRHLIASWEAGLVCIYLTKIIVVMKHFFYKGKRNLLSDLESETFDESVKVVKKEFSKLLESRNLSFLIGSGCSLGANGIPTMIQLAKSFYEPTEDALEAMSEHLKKLVLSDDSKDILTEYGIDYKSQPFSANLETFLGTLYSLRFYLDQINNAKELQKIDNVIDETKHFILYQCLNEDNVGKDGAILENYTNFYRKLSLRDSNLPKPNIFTTNYDLYSEKAMDELGITYTNGFSGFVERYFNPSIFNYALAEQMDISSFKWSIIDSYIYLFKIHGSVNWIEVNDGNKLFKIKELQNSSFKFLKQQTNLMIYPSPIKQNASLGTPYSDLFREFQKRIAQKQSVLVTMGYSFGDEHINNLIFQALTIPTFRLVIFSDLGGYVNGEFNLVRANIDKLKELNDPRIWIIGSDSEYTTTDVELIITEDSTSTDADDLFGELEAELTPKEETEAIEEVEKEAGELKYHEKNPSSALHYFNVITRELLPDWSENIIESQNEKIIKLLSNPKKLTND